MELEFDKSIERGLPIAWNRHFVQLLRVDGSIAEFEPASIHRHRILDEDFVPDNAMRIRGQLQREFGRGYAVEGGGNFAIVAPNESIQLWVQRFSQIDQAFQRYFVTRGYPLRPAEFPLIGIVFPSQADFWRYAEQTGEKLQTGAVGYYSIRSNRLYLFEMRGNEEAEREAMATVWHEAAHLLAFNRGVHQRLSAPPLWMLEGIASIFEAPGMMAQRTTMNSSDLINVSRWEHWKKLSHAPEKMAALLDRLIRDDRLFQSQPQDAYTIAWGVSLYLSERDTSHFIPYVQRLSQLAPGIRYSDQARIQDFQRSFPTNSLLLIKSADRFLQAL